MVRTLCFLVGVAAAAAAEDVIDDLTSMLQTHVSQHNQNQACMPVKLGDIAPANGLFNGQQVQIGEVAQESGTFCVDKEVLALIQRSFGLSSLKDIEVSVNTKPGQQTKKVVPAVPKPCDACTSSHLRFEQKCIVSEKYGHKCTTPSESHYCKNAAGNNRVSHCMANPCDACTHPHALRSGQKCIVSTFHGHKCTNPSQSHYCYNAAGNHRVSHCVAPTLLETASVNQEAQLATVLTQDLDATSFLTPDPTETGLLEQTSVNQEDLETPALAQTASVALDKD